MLKTRKFFIIKLTYCLSTVLVCSSVAVNTEVQRFTGGAKSPTYKVQGTSLSRTVSRKCENYQIELEYYKSLAKQGHSSSQGEYYRKKRREFKKKLKNDCKQYLEKTIR